MRTRVVWLVFAVSMTVFGMIFLSGEWSGTPQMVRVAPYSDVDTNTVASSTSGIAPRSARMESKRWDSIVVHHSGHPLDDHESIARRHRISFGFSELGYHFVIGNGSKGLGDGEAFVSVRWDRQLDGAHVPGANEPVHRVVATNQRSIGICLVGNGNVRRFTPAQIERLLAVIVRLQRDFDISDDRVLLASDVSQVTSPGRVFPTMEFEQRLALED
jgi:N-acetyl-anhydromuramyl-L-alanine amidase AmpD